VRSRDVARLQWGKERQWTINDISKKLQEALMRSLAWEKKGNNAEKLDAALFERSRSHATAAGADADTGATMTQGEVDSVLDEQHRKPRKS
jgi:hypothetical protein